MNSKICRTVILPAVVYGCETWSPTLKKGRRLRLFENGMLKNNLGLTGERNMALARIFERYVNSVQHVAFFVLLLT
jgi:hypothetical protein